MTMAAKGVRMEEPKITSLEDLTKLRAKDGEVIELPAFDSKIPFHAKVRRPSLLKLCEAGIVPNSLLGIVRELYEGQIKGDIPKYYELLKIVAEQALVEPKFEDVKDIITDEQLGTIFDYVQQGVAALSKFRQDGKLQEIINILLQNEHKNIKTDKDKK